MKIVIFDFALDLSRKLYKIDPYIVTIKGKAFELYHFKMTLIIII